MVRLLMSLLLVVSLAAPSALAAKRVALVIGNNDYEQLPDLVKALNDARDMRTTLREHLGFSIIYGENLDRRGMNRAVLDLEASIAKDDIVFIYYSGHGVSLGAENYLLPTDLPKPRDGEAALVAADSIGAEALTRRVQARGARAVFAILDACRDSPFANAASKTLGGLGGLNKIDAAEGVFVLFAAGLGQTALDRLSEDDPNRDSVFTRSLIPLLKTPGLSQVDLAKRVQQKVAALAATIGHDQKPAYYDQILGFVSLKEDAAALPTVEETPSEAGPTPAEAAWARIGETADEAAVIAFLATHGGDARYRERAERRLEELRRRKQAALAPEPPQAAAGTVWEHNGSLLTLTAEGTRRVFTYLAPRDVLARAGVRRGTVLFVGERRAERYVGKAKVFSRSCGRPREYAVDGFVESERRIVLVGTREVYDSQCRPTGNFITDRLVFSYRPAN